MREDMAHNPDAELPLLLRLHQAEQHAAEAERAMINLTATLRTTTAALRQVTAELRAQTALVQQLRDQHDGENFTPWTTR